MCKERELKLVRKRRDLLHLTVGEELAAHTFMQKARAGAHGSWSPHGGFWRFPDISEERKRILTCVMQMMGW